MIKEKEIWKNIEFYENYYQISSYGRVKSLKRFYVNKYNEKRKVKEKILLLGQSTKGYIRVCFSKNGVRKIVFIHHLVAKYFIDNPENKSQINHIDGDKTNNYYKNLEWNTPTENIQHAYKVKLKNNNYLKKSVLVYLNGKLIMDFNSRVDAGKWRGVTKETITRYINKTRNDPKRYVWKNE